MNDIAVVPVQHNLINYLFIIGDIFANNRNIEVLLRSGNGKDYKKYLQEFHKN